jgi:hypothetical protein
VSIFEGVSFHLAQAAAKVTIDPTDGGLPGFDSVQKLLNGAAKFAILACVGAFLIGAAQWGWATRSNNYSQAADGKERMLKSVDGAFAVGAVAAVINFFYQAGTGVS